MVEFSRTTTCQEFGPQQIEVSTLDIQVNHLGAAWIVVEMLAAASLSVFDLGTIATFLVV